MVCHTQKKTENDCIRAGCHKKLLIKSGKIFIYLSRFDLHRSVAVVCRIFLTISRQEIFVKEMSFDLRQETTFHFKIREGNNNIASRAI